MKVGVIKVHLQVPGSRSLKEKRHAIRSLKDPDTRVVNP